MWNCTRSQFHQSFFHFFQLVLVTIVLLAAFGNDGLRLTFGVEDFLGVGTSLGLALTVPLILLAYILGGSLFVMVSRFRKSGTRSVSRFPDEERKMNYSDWFVSNTMEKLWKYLYFPRHTRAHLHDDSANSFLPDSLKWNKKLRRQKSLFKTGTTALCQKISLKSLHSGWEIIFS